MPSLDAHSGTGFMDIRTGRRVEHALVTYAGMDVTADDLLERLVEKHKLPVPREAALTRLTVFVATLRGFRVGNVLRITYVADGAFELIKHANRPTPMEERRRLPG
jgi:hypothetical protein